MPLPRRPPPAAPLSQRCRVNRIEPHPNFLIQPCSRTDPPLLLPAAQHHAAGPQRWKRSQWHTSTYRSHRECTRHPQRSDSNMRPSPLQHLLTATARAPPLPHFYTSTHDMQGRVSTGAGGRWGRGGGLAVCWQVPSPCGDRLCPCAICQEVHLRRGGACHHGEGTRRSKPTFHEVVMAAELPIVGAPLSARRC